MSRTANAITLGLILASVAGAATPATPTTRPSAEQVLERRLPEVRFDQVTLADVIAFLRDMTGLNIVVQWRELETAGIAQSTPISLNVRDVPFKEVLRLIVDDLRIAGPVNYELRDNLLVIGIDVASRQPAETVVYKVSDLVDPADSSEVERLVGIITSSVGRETWMENGGTVGSIQSLRGSLVITQAPSHQQAVKELLAKLREAAKDAPPSARSQAAVSAAKVKLVADMRETCFNAEAMGIVAVGGLQHESQLPPAELARVLESHLANAKSLGLRNAIRLALKDLYLDMGQAIQARAHLEAMIRENDGALQQPK